MITSVLLVDDKRTLLDDVKLEMLVQGLTDVDADTCLAGTREELTGKLHEKVYNFIIVNQKMLKHLRKEDFGDIRVYGYTGKNEKPMILDAAGIPYMGQVADTSDLVHILDDILMGRIPKPSAQARPAEAPKKPEPKAPVPAPKPEAFDADGLVDLTDFDEPAREPAQKPVPEPARRPAETQGAQAAPQPAPKPQPAPQATKTSPVAQPQQEQIQHQDGIRKVRDQRRPEPKPLTIGTKLRNDHIRREQEDQYRNLETQKPEKKTRTVAVFSAKGGVGKTTISCNLAMFLSLMAHGRGNYRVCLVDYNIDFGDVRSTLGFDDSTLDMAAWAEEIHTQLVHGKAPEDVTFSRSQIEQYLTTHQSSGLYALLAPVRHEDAMALDADELQIMLRNVIDFGEFDFVICDTGNNTRDNTYFALDAADTIILVCTQDATTATCNGSALNALKRAGIDIGKVCIVVNNVMSAKITGISAQEVEEAFSAYPCIARIRRNDDIIRANNYSTPLVMKPNHVFTQEMRRIVAHVTQESLEQTEAPKKKGLLGFLSR